LKLTIIIIIIIWLRAFKVNNYYCNSGGKSKTFDHKFKRSLPK